MTTPIPRTAAEILARLEGAKQRDFFGAESNRLVAALTFEQAKSADIPKDGVTEQQWNEAGLLRTVEDVTAAIIDYLPFAWSKANDCRGLSANRSLEHLRGLCWLLGASGQAIVEHPDFGDDYAYYGKPALVRASELVGFNWRAVDNDHWVNGEFEDGISADRALGLIPARKDHVCRSKPGSYGTCERCGGEVK